MKNVPFDILHKQYAPMIQSFIRELHVKHDFAHFENIGLIALWQAQQGFTKGDAAQFAAYAYAKIRGAMLDEFRRNAVYNETVKLFDTLPDNPTANVTYENVLALVDEVLRYVPKHDAELFRLIYVQGYTLQEAAVHFGVPYTTLTRRHARLMKKLQQLKENFM